MSVRGKMKKQVIHLLAPRGRVDSAKTWSGIPKNVAMALAKQGYLGDIRNEERISLYQSLSKWFAGRTGIISRRVQNRLLARDKIRRVEYFCRNRPDDVVVLASLSHFPVNRRIRNAAVLVDFPAYAWMELQARERNESLREDEVVRLKKWEKRCYQQAAHIFTLGNHCLERIVGEFGIPEKKITAIGTGFSVGADGVGFNPKTFEKKRLFFLAKNREILKGCEVVFQAFQKIRAVDSEAELTFAGSPIFADKYSGRNGVTTLGFLNQEKGEVEQLFRENNFFLMPSDSEPWGIVFLEALVSGLPILGLNTNGFPEISGNGKFGFAVERQDPDLIARVVLDAFKDIDRLESISRKAPCYVRKTFTWDHAVDRMVKGLERTLWRNPD